ncbi:hypothetical protein M0R45_007594 [Rubus argutus]|uniref:B-like cyclin n=1 Tax=Rubus argutus TaxID=59490 RepID=A0AAW1XZ74_RUBAR
MKFTKELKDGRRGCINWMLKKAEPGLRDSTVFMAIHMLDKYLSTVKEEVSVDKLKKLRVTCLSISSKTEESNFPSHLWDDGPFSLLDNTEDMSLHKMESEVLEKLDWELCWITPWEFTDYCATKLSSKDYDKGINTIAHSPSVIAVAAVIVGFNLKIADMQYDLEPFNLLNITQGQVQSIVSEYQVEHAMSQGRQRRKGRPQRAPAF